ncbi:MAG TPA: anthranilate synthase component I family protein, partial [Candidatus Angelobacter sp.]|nr:anthranilate synthase component I family protein [Candidatus Angelobacter sp.]
MSAPDAAWARFGGRTATGLLDVTADPAALDSAGWWAVVAAYAGPSVFARFSDVRPGPTPAGAWSGPAPTAWASSMSREQYVAAVEQVRDHIVAGTVYQANVCRVLSARLPDRRRADVAGLAALLDVGNPAPYA